MGVTATNLTSGNDTTNQATFTTASITPTGNRLVLLAVANSKTSTPDTPTATGNGLTWVQIATVTSNTIATPLKRLTLFRAMGASPTTGAISIAHGGVNQSGAAWSVVEFAGVPTSGTNGDRAIVQSATNNVDTNTTLTVTLSAFNNVKDATYGAFGSTSNNGGNAGSGFTEQHDTAYSNPSTGLLTEFRIDNDTSVDVTFQSSDIAGIAVEIASLTKTQTHALDAIILKTSTKTHTIDTLIQSITVVTKTHSISAVKNLLGMPSHDIDFNISLAQIKAIHAIDAKLYGSPKKVQTIDAFFTLQKKRQTALDIKKTKAGNTKTHGVSSILDTGLARRAYTMDVVINAPLHFRYQAALMLNGIMLSDHNRTPITIDLNELKIDTRKANTDLSRTTIAIKKTFATSWEMLPSYDTETVDFKAGRISLRNLVENSGNMPMVLIYRDLVTQVSIETTVKITDYSEELQKRYNSYYWNVSITLEEV